jgi:NAD(P)-dependent dehydrogenase (short-subunit alcohol dehydrogenase family)
VAIVTGANTGVGLQTALGLARKPHAFHVILSCRSESRGRTAVDWLHSQCAGASASFEQLDLASFDSVRNFTERIATQYSEYGIHVVVCNAGIGGLDRRAEPTAEGSADLIYRVNYVSHFVLVLRLLPLLERGFKRSLTTSRVVTVSSVMHRFGHTRWLDGLAFDPTHRTYSVSKLALAVFAAELTRRCASRGIIGVAVNPGACDSDIWYRGDDSWGERAHWQRSLLQWCFRHFFLSTEQGAATSVSAATDPSWVDGEGGGRPPDAQYLSPYRTPATRPMPFELHGPFAGARLCLPHAAVLDGTQGAALWEGVATDARVAPWLK